MTPVTRNAIVKHLNEIEHLIQVLATRPVTQKAILMQTAKIKLALMSDAGYE